MFTRRKRDAARREVAATRVHATALASEAFAGLVAGILAAYQYVDGVVADAHDNSAPSDDEDHDDDEERPGTADFMLPATGEGILDDDQVFDADD